MLKELSKNLIISTVGDKSLHNRWSHKNDYYDTFLIYYGNKNGYENESTFYRKEQGFKYHLIQSALQENPWIYGYDYIWLPDDDLLAHPKDIVKLFQIMQRYGLWIAQPSIFGWYGTPVTIPQFDSILRYTNWIEIMCPCFSSEALKTCQSSFRENSTGWSIEGIWNILLNHPRDKFAIIDDVSVIHTREVLTGDTYSGQNNALSYAREDGVKVCKKWNLVEEYKKDIPFGKVVDCDIKYFVEYNKIKKDTFNRGFYPNSEIHRSLIENLL